MLREELLIPLLYKSLNDSLLGQISYYQRLAES